MRALFSDEFLMYSFDRYIGYNAPCDYVKDPTRARGADMSIGITDTTISVIQDAYNDYLIACEW